MILCLIAAEVGNRCSRSAAAFALMDLLHFVIRRKEALATVGCCYGQGFYHQTPGLVSLSLPVSDGEILADILPELLPKVRKALILDLSQAHVQGLS